MPCICWRGTVRLSGRTRNRNGAHGPKRAPRFWSEVSPIFSWSNPSGQPAAGSGDVILLQASYAPPGRLQGVIRKFGLSTLTLHVESQNFRRYWP
jgi:hypothetical protein